MFGNMRSHLMSGFLSILLLTFSQVLPATGQTLQQGPMPSRITAPIDNAVRATIPRTTHPMAQAQFDRGPMDPGLQMSRMLLVLSPSEEQEHQLRTLLDSQQTKGSPDYHQWLTPEAFGQKFGPSPQDIQQVTGWLQQQGFSVASVAKGGRWIEFSGTVGQVQAAFHTQMRNYQVKGKTHFANASDISIPAALSQVVRGVSLHNFFSKPMHQRLGTARRTQDGRYVRVNPDGTFVNGTVHALAPGDFAMIYNLTPLYASTLTGAGQTIAIVARSNVDQVDLSDFNNAFGVGGSNVSVILNGPNPGLVPGDQDEATLDVEWSSALAPGALIELVVSAIVDSTSTDGVDLSAAFIVDNNLGSVMSTSFGQCEQSMGAAENLFWNNLWEQAAAQGISAFVSAGDNGAAGCDDPNTTVATGGPAVSGLASTPFNTAVGGTEFDESLAPGGDATFWSTTNTATFVSVKGYIPEMVWNESCSVASCGAANANLFAGSGGLSTVYLTTPSWQSATGIPGLNFTVRAIPDVSLAAAGGHDGFLTCDTESCQQGEFAVFGGTSLSSPSFAAIMSIVDQSQAGRQGLANYTLYSLAKNETFSSCNSANRIDPTVANPTSCVFNDTTKGTNTVPGQTGFSAVTGYDLATGLGSVDANNLVKAWGTTTFKGSTTAFSVTSPGLTAGALNIAHGAPVSIALNVAAVSGTTSPTGTVSLTAAGGNLTGSVGVAGTPISGSGGTATGSLNINNLPGGTTYQLVAHYPGDATFSASASAPLTVTVTPEPSTTSVAVSPATVPYGGVFDLSTVVASSANASPPDGFPSGTVTIKDNGTSIGTLTLNNRGVAELFNCITMAPANPPPCLTVGSHPIQVFYGGDAGFGVSNTAAAAVTITVTKAVSTGSLTTPATAQSGAPFSVSAKVNAAGPIFATGTVQFFQGTTSLGAPVTLTAGNPSTASTQITLPGSGSETVTAQYSGDSTYGSATLGPNTIGITSPFTFTATSTSATIPAGQSATFNLTLNNTNFNGAVNFTCTGAPGGSNCAVSPNPANLTPTTATVPLTVTVSNTANARLAPAPFKTLPFVFAAAIVGLFAGTRKKPRKAVLAVLAFALIVGVGSCGGGGGSSNVVNKQPTVANLTVTGANGSISTSINLTLTITH